MNLKEILDKEAKARDSIDEVNSDRPDPILVAREYKDEYISLICSLFAYGKASLIVKFLQSFDFSIIDRDEYKIREELSKHYYRFQNSIDVAEFFITIKRLKNIDSLENIFLKGYNKESSIIDGIHSLISKIEELNGYESSGYRFLIGNLPNREKIHKNSPYKRWNMFFRWMVRCDNIDLGLWSGVDRKDLILPLDTHTFKVSQKLGLLNRKSYDLKSALLITERLREFDPKDPIKYDFAIYRLGQEMKI
jgi:uncharacterized protein (TIGR02757 family)